ncbi:hypothetical protein B0T10DRAFT_516308 [Thelonectria olida]|uniref:Uncharacterized protein n=1 Tax=Thelonectria olida TaxID=1576542 RepID=A0A9P9ANB7_9HYPO|nr:hypothetical protein B0T10DRAFT_516308 [Thelonectria olida]
MTEKSSGMSELLTVIITTSVTPSSPSTDLVSSVLDSFKQHCPSLLKCRAIVVFDGYDQVVTTARLKKGCVTRDQARDFDAYRENVKDLILSQYLHGSDSTVLTRGDAEAEYGSAHGAHNVVPYATSQTHDKRVTFIEPTRRLGFGLAVRSALRMTETPYVWVQQHDWVMVSDFPIEPLLEIMMNSKSDPEIPIKYVCLPAVRMLSYAASADVVDFPALKNLASTLKRDFQPKMDSDVTVPLTPMFFWHDKPHVASTSHYLERVFPSRLAMLRGDFIEDKIGQRARAQMKDGLWTKWATWLYYPDEGKQLCLRHLQGRTRDTADKEIERGMLWRQKNEAAARSTVVEVSSKENRL